MAIGLPVPISEVVLRWALDRSGYTIEEFANALKIDEGSIREWLSGSRIPNVSEFNKITKILHRPAAIFFMQEPPTDTLPRVSFRAPLDLDRKGPNPTELRYIREASRLQSTISWIRDEMNESDFNVPRFQISQKPEIVATQVRRHLLALAATANGFVDTQTPWKIWRQRLEDVGIVVLALPLGKLSSRGFSLWDDKAPLIAINTGWNNQARLFSMIHELGHLITRTQSVCVESIDGRVSKSPDKVERWAERFSASVLMPWDEVSHFLRVRLGIRENSHVGDISIANQIAKAFDTSLRATVIRLIEHEMATWDLYRQIPAISDAKRSGGGGKGRLRHQKRVDEYGKRTFEDFAKAVNSGLLHRSEALSYLNVGDNDLSPLSQPD